MIQTDNAATSSQRGENNMIGSETLRNIKFSIEAEVSIPSRSLRANNINVGAYHYGTQVPSLAGREWNGWTAERDSSLETPVRGRVMVEFVGPVLSGPEGIQEIADFLAAISSIGARVNNSCGLHINISHPNLFRVVALRRLIRLTARHEQALWAINGSPTRENNLTGGTNYCKSIKQAYRTNGYSEMRALRLIGDTYHDRYHTLNLQHVHRSPSTRRVEFRVPAASVNSAKVTAFLRVFLGLVEAAIDGKGKPTWDIVKSERDNDLPDGVHALRKLFTTLGWKPSASLRGQIHSNNIRPIITDATSPWAVKAKGIMTGSPEEAADAAETSAAILMKLARKYDTIKGATWRTNRRTSYGAF
jgi:hypothetical protein